MNFSFFKNCVLRGLFVGLCWKESLVHIRHQNRGFDLAFFFDFFYRDKSLEKHVFDWDNISKKCSNILPQFREKKGWPNLFVRETFYGNFSWSSKCLPRKISLVTSRDSSESLMKLMSLGRLWYWIEILSTVWKVESVSCERIQSDARKAEWSSTEFYKSCAAVMFYFTFKW